MSDVRELQRLRIYLSETDEIHHRALARALVETAHRQGLAGATAFQGTEGFGGSGALHSAHIFRLADSLPIIVECIDQPAAIERALAEFTRMAPGCFFTLETLQGGRFPDGPPPVPARDMAP